MKYTLIERKDNVAVLALQYSLESQIIGYDVVVLSKDDRRFNAERVKDLKHSITGLEGYRLPPSEKWGTYGWSFSTKEAAMFKFNELIVK